MEKDKIVTRMSSIENLIFMDASKLNNFFRNQNKEDTITEKSNTQKVIKIKSKLHRNSFWMLRMTIIFFKFIGLATFVQHIVARKKRLSFQYSKFGIVYNVILITSVIISNFWSIPFRLFENYENRSNLTIGIETLQGLLGTLVICAILFFNCIDQKSLMRIANRLMNVELEIDHLYHLYRPLQRQRVLWGAIIICILQICLMILLAATDYLAFESGPVSWLSDIVPTSHVNWLLIQYLMLIMIIQANFIDVNQAIRNLTRVGTPDLRPQSLTQTRRVVISNSTIHQLLQLRDVHSHLYEISEDVSGFYSLPILFGITFVFLTLIYNGYYLLAPLLMSDKFLDYYKLINTIIWLICLIYPISLLTNRITKILKEMQKTGDVIHDLLSCAIGKETKSEVRHKILRVKIFSRRTPKNVTTFTTDLLQLKQFSLQLLHRNVQFTANGYFSLDNTFLHSLIGTVATYLVILVQFQMGSSCSSKQYCNCTKEAK